MNCYLVSPNRTKYICCIASFCIQYTIHSTNCIQIIFCQSHCTHYLNIHQVLLIEICIS